MDLYREQLLDHYHNPRGWGLQLSADLQEQGFNPVCGDAITVQVSLVDDVVSAMYFEAQGCVISRAAASLLSEYIAQKPTREVELLTLTDIQMLLGSQVPAGRVQCALLALTTLQQALKKK